jgi:hypothetical protein
MDKDNIVFLEVIEWFDETGQELVHRIPERGPGEIKFGVQMNVRESQAGGPPEMGFMMPPTRIPLLIAALCVFAQGEFPPGLLKVSGCLL